MADNREPPPLFDDDPRKEDDTDDLFSSAVQSPVNGTDSPDLTGKGAITPKPTQPSDPPSDHPLSDPLQAFPQPSNPTNESDHTISTEPKSPTTKDSVEEKSNSHPDLIDNITSNIRNLPPVPSNMYNISSIDAAGPASLQDSNMDLFESCVEDSIVRPLATVDLNDQHQEISLDDDDDGLFSGGLNNAQHGTTTTTTIGSNAAVLPPVGVPITPPTASPPPPVVNTDTTPPVTDFTSTNANLVASSRMDANDNDEFIEIVISEPQKVGEGMGSYMAYKVTVRTNIRYFKKTQWTVSRRFSDFLGLHAKLVEKYLHAGRIIPPAPEKDAINTTKLRLGSGESVDGAAEFLERRRASLQRFMQRTATLPHLRVDPDFKEFIELESELPKATQTSAMSGAGVMRLFNKIGENVNKMTFKMDENDQWFEDRVHQMESLETELRRLHGALEGLAGGRRELALSSSSLSKAAAVLSSVEEHSALSRALHQLAEATDRTHTVYHAQADADFYILCETTRDYINLIGAVKEVLHERVKVYQAWTYSQTMLAKKREAKAKLELAARQDKVSQAQAEVTEWEGKVERNKENFEHISVAIKKEMEQFDVVRVQDFKSMLIRYLEAMLTSQQQVIKVWETFLPEAKAIS